MPINHLDDLRVFVQIVDSGSLAGAGRALQLSPPLVSRRLARLEGALDVCLVQRTTRRLHITDEGRRFYARSRRILGELEAAEQEVRPSSREVKGLVRAVLPSSMLHYGIMPALGAFLDIHPGLSVQIKLSDKPVDLLAGGFDVATHIGPPKDTSHIGRRLGSLSPCLAATPEHLAAHGMPEVPADLSQHQCIRSAIFSPATFWPIIDTDGVTHRIPVGGRLLLEDVISMLNALYSGLGIGILPRALLRKAVAGGLLVEVLPGCTVSPVTLYALMPEQRQKIPRVRVFTDWLARFMTALDA